MIEFNWKYKTKDGNGFIIEQFDENEIKSDEATDIEDDYYKNPSDWLFEIKLVEKMRDSVIRANYNIKDKNINIACDTVKRFYAYAKVILQESERAKQKENDGEIRESIRKYINYWREISSKGGANRWNTGQEETESIEKRNEYNELKTQIIGFSERMEEDIIKIEERFKQPGKVSIPYNVFEKMTKRVSKNTILRRDLVKVIRSTSNSRTASVNGELTCQMVLNDDSYAQYIDDNKIDFSKNIEDSINSFMDLGHDDVDFIEIIDHMKKAIDSCDKSNNHIFGRYSGDKKGCYSILETENKRYISLSGPFDVVDERIVNYIGFDEDKKRSNNSLMDKINNYILTSPDFCDADYSRICPETKRYPYPNNQQIAQNGESVYNAIDNGVAPKDICSDYSCCERKMFAYAQSNMDGDCLLFARHQPCPKCKPAIKMLQTQCNMRIYYCEDDVVKEFDMNTL